MAQKFVLSLRSGRRPRLEGRTVEIRREAA
jgi:hypothetical protein